MFHEHTRKLSLSPDALTGGVQALLEVGRLDRTMLVLVKRYVRVRDSELPRDNFTVPGRLCSKCSDPL